jgi:aerobic C4-dicarboxylate transport protein
VALAVGLIVGKVLQPGRGFNIDPATIDPHSVSSYVTQAKEQGIVSHLMAIIPDSYFDALARGDLLQLLVSILSGFAIAFLGKTGEPISRAVDQAAKMFFGIIRMIARRAARGVRCDGVYGRRLWPQFAVEPDCADRHILSDQHIVRVDRARSIARLSLIIRFILYIKDELLIVLGTSSSETAAADHSEDGASRRIAAGGRPRRSDGLQLQSRRHQYHMTLATLFLAQATNTHLTIWQELGSRRGDHYLHSLRRHRGRLITLAATLSIVPDILIQSIAILVGVGERVPH